MKRLNLLIKPASSMCNMRCRYCFYSGIGSTRKTSSYGVMSKDITDKILDNIFMDINAGDEINFAFQGGEPTLAGLSWFQYFAENVSARKKDCKINYAFQTNGLLLDEPWCDFFCENNFLVGLSIDVSKRFHDRNRFFANSVHADSKEYPANGTFETCLRTKNLLDKKRVEYNVLCVLTNDIAKDPERAWRFIINESVRFIQFIPCLEPPDSKSPFKESSGNTLRPAFFAKFYSKLFPLWVKELEKGNYISIKLFDDVANYFFKGIPGSCGINGDCHHQYVIESDGSVYPCDFYAIDNYKIGNLADSTPRELFDTEKVRDFLAEKPELPKICGLCQFFKACRGGCKRMRNVMYADAGEAVCGFKSFLEKCLEPLELATRRLLR